MNIILQIILSIASLTLSQCVAVTVFSTEQDSKCSVDTLVFRNLQLDVKWIYHATYTRQAEIYYETLLPKEAQDVQLHLRVNVTCTFVGEPFVDTLRGEMVGVNGEGRSVWVFKTGLPGTMGSGDYKMESLASVEYTLGDGQVQSCSYANGKRKDELSENGVPAFADHYGLLGSAYGMHGSELVSVVTNILGKKSDRILPILYQTLCEGSSLYVYYSLDKFKTRGVKQINLASIETSSVSLEYPDLFPDEQEYEFYVVLQTCNLIFRDDNFGKYYQR